MKLTTLKEVTKLVILFATFLLLLWFGAKLLAASTRQIATSAATEHAVVQKLESIRADIIAEVNRSREARLAQVKQEAKETLDQKVETIESKATKAAKRVERVERKTDGLAKLLPVLVVTPEPEPSVMPTPTRRPQTLYELFHGN